MADQGLQAPKEGFKGVRETEPWPPWVLKFFFFSWLWAIPGAWILGIGVTFIYVSQVPSGVRWSIFATVIAIAVAAFLAGGITGFLFGVPQTVHSSASSTGVTQYLGNTNLEQVSDWLTKIIVGVGLVQIGRAIPALRKLAESMKAPLGGQAWSGTFGLAVVISSALLGFLGFYLWSRSLAAREFSTFNTNQLQNDTKESR